MIIRKLYEIIKFKKKHETHQISIFSMFKVAKTSNETETGLVRVTKCQDQGMLLNIKIKLSINWIRKYNYSA